MNDQLRYGTEPGSLARREFLSWCGAAAGLAVAPAAVAARRRRLGIVEITLVRELAEDYGGTLRRLPSMGYTHFGFAMSAAGGRLPASREKAALVRDSGLEVGGARFGISADMHERDIEDAAAIGAGSIALSAASVFTSGPRLGVASRADFDRWLPQLVTLSSLCRKAGVALCYHNHWWDLQPLDGGETPLDVIARALPPSDLSFEIDLAWCWYAGVPPLDLIARLGPRVRAMHLKDVDRTLAAPLRPGADRAEQSLFTGRQAVVIGRGEMGYASLLPRLARMTSALGYIEVDRPADGLAAAADAASFHAAHT